MNSIHRNELNRKACGRLVLGRTGTMGNSFVWTDHVEV